MPPIPWRISDIHAIARALRSGTRWDAILAAHGRSHDAVALALLRLGYRYGALCAEGRLVRVQAIVSGGGGAREVMASEGVKERAAHRLISEALDADDRRKKPMSPEVRAAYNAVREHGFKGAAEHLQRPVTSVRRDAERYRRDVCPKSPPFV